VGLTLVDRVADAKSVTSSMIEITVVAAFVGVAVFGVASAIASKRPEREARVVFHGASELMGGLLCIAMSAHLLLSGFRGVALVLALIALGLTAAAIQAFTQLRAIRAQQKAQE
jgi:hypothetical protein